MRHSAEMSGPWSIKLGQCLVGNIPAGKPGILGNGCDGTTTAGSLGSATGSCLSGTASPVLWLRIQFRSQHFLECRPWRVAQELQPSVRPWASIQCLGSCTLSGRRAKSSGTISTGSWSITAGAGPAESTARMNLPTNSRGYIIGKTSFRLFAWKNFNSPSIIATTKCANEFLTGYRYPAVTNLPMLLTLSGVSARTLEQNIAVTAFFWSTWFLRTFRPLNPVSIQLRMQVVHRNNIPWTSFPANQTVDHVNTCFPQFKTQHRKKFFHLTDSTLHWTNSIMVLGTCFVDGEFPRNASSPQRRTELIGRVRPEINRLRISRQQSKLCQGLADMLAGGVNVLAYSGETQ